MLGLSLSSTETFPLCRPFPSLTEQSEDVPGLVKAFLLQQYVQTKTVK